jgi:cytochrome c peroxidase
MGGAALELQGHRSSPSIRYLATNTSFFFDAEGTPTGGFFWDGRASSLQDQAARPFTNPVEMANTDVASVIDKLSREKTDNPAEKLALLSSWLLYQAETLAERQAIKAAINARNLEELEKRLNAKFAAVTEPAKAEAKADAKKPAKKKGKGK